MSAALGWTISTTAAAGTTPAIGTWTKPANVPYLNLFCDPTAYHVQLGRTRSPTSRGSGLRQNDSGSTKRAGRFDGPLFDLPGGTVKAAIGATYHQLPASDHRLDNTGASSLIVPYQQDAQGRQVWAVFTQINVPIFSEQNALPFFRRVELEFSWRHDQYSDVGGTSNPKVAFNWAPIEDLTIRGTWGTSFRAPAFGELSPLANVAIAGQNLGSFAAAAGADRRRGCTVGSSLPPVGSGAWKVQSSTGNGMPGSATACAARRCLDLPPGGISMNGGSGGAEAIRAGGGWDGAGADLKPELATNWGIGFDYTPTGNFLTGLNIQATYYIIKINSVLRGFGNPVTDSFNDPTLGDFAFLVPTDLANIRPSGRAGCTNNLLPTTCAPFQDAVPGLLAQPGSTRRSAGQDADHVDQRRRHLQQGLV